MKRILIASFFFALSLGACDCEGNPDSGDGQNADGGGSSIADVGVDATVGQCEDLDGDFYGRNCARGDDCDDFNDEVHPGASEICGDGIDNDCNASTSDTDGCNCPFQGMLQGSERRFDKCQHQAD